MIRFISRIRGLAHGGQDRLIAGAAADQANRLREQSPVAPLLRALGREPNEGACLLGFTADTGEPVWLTHRELVGLAAWIVGATGSGKSAEAYALQLPFVVPRRKASWQLLDAKGEGAQFMCRTALPALLSDWDAADQDGFLESFRCVDFFDGACLPPGNLLAPRSGMARELHARDVVDLIASGLGARYADFGARMVASLMHLVVLGLSVGGLSLVELREVLVNPAYRAGLLAFTDDEATRGYFLHHFPKENPQTVLGLRARLDLLLFGDNERILAAPTSFDYDATLQNGTTIFDLGSNVPHGASYLQRFYLTQAVRGLVRAIAGRKESTRPAFLFWDEAWMALEGSLEDELEALFTVWLRHRRVSLTLLNQLPSQIARRAPAVLAALKNSAALEFVFRQGAIEDAKDVAHIIPTGHLEYVPSAPDTPWDLRPATTAEQKRIGVETLTRLPDRTFWFHHKKRGLAAALLRSPTIPFDDLRRAADQAPRELKERCLGRAGGHSRRDLDQFLARRRAHIRAVAEGATKTGRPDLFDQRPLSVGPDSANPRGVTPPALLDTAPASVTAGVGVPTPPPIPAAALAASTAKAVAPSTPDDTHPIGTLPTHSPDGGGDPSTQPKKPRSTVDRRKGGLPSLG